MVVFEQDNIGFIVGFLEFEIVNDLGQFKNYGEYIYIQNAWIHETLRNSLVLRKLITKVDYHKFCFNAFWVYWRNDKTGKLTKPFPRKRLAKLGV